MDASAAAAENMSFTAPPPGAWKSPGRFGAPALPENYHAEEPFGVELYPTDQTTNNIKYTGQEEDACTGNLNLNFRFYQDAIGRFLKPDNIPGDPANPQSWNRYSYVDGNPVSLNDPTGHIPRSPSRLNIFKAGPEGFSLGETFVAPDISWTPGETIVLNTTAIVEEGTSSNAITIMHYEEGGWSGPTATVTSADRMITGINLTLQQAADKAFTVMVQQLGKCNFDLVYIKTLGFLKDCIRAVGDKLGFTSQAARELAGIIKQAGPGNWYAHSYGGIAFAEAVRTITAEGGTVSGQSVLFMAGANNQWATNRIMRKAGVGVGGYTGRWLDAVPNVVGLNSLNPVQYVIDILMIWHLFTPASTHSIPPVR